MRSFGYLSMAMGACISVATLGCVVDRETNDDGQGGDNAGGSSSSGLDPDKTMLRVVHASADAPPVDVWVKGGSAPLVSGIAYGGATTWVEVEAGTYDLELRVSPSTAADPAVYATGPVTLEKGEKLSAIAAGLIGSTADANKFRVLAVKEEFAPAGSGSAIVRVVHASPDAPTVGIDLHDDDASSPEISNIDRFTDSGAAGFPLTAGESLQIGIAAGGNRVTAFTTPPLPEGEQILVIATGLVAERANEVDGFALLAVGVDGAIGFIKQNPMVYALHASPDAPAVDLYAGDAALVSNISFGQLSKPLQVPPGDYTIDFRAAGADPSGAPAASAKTGALSAGESYLSIATGFLGSSGADGFRLASYEERFDRTNAEAARARLVHGSPDAPAVDIGILNVENRVNPVLVSNISFGDASAADGLDTGTGTIPLGVTPAGSNDTVVASFHVVATAGLRAFAVAAGSLSPEKGESFRLLVVDTQTTPWAVATIHPQPQL